MLPQYAEAVGMREDIELLRLQYEGRDAGCGRLEGDGRHVIWGRCDAVNGGLVVDVSSCHDRRCTDLLLSHRRGVVHDLVSLLGDITDPTPMGRRYLCGSSGRRPHRGALTVISRVGALHRKRTQEGGLHLLIRYANVIGAAYQVRRGT